MRDLHWILVGKDHTPVAFDTSTEERLIEWARWFSDFDKRRVAEDFTRYYRVSSVFLGIDHQFGKGPPLLFETMIFERKETVKLVFGRMRRYQEEAFDAMADGQTQWRFATWDDTLANHNAIVRRLHRQEKVALDLVHKLRTKQSG